jgi:hypothetical protein
MENAVINEEHVQENVKCSYFIQFFLVHGEQLPEPTTEEGEVNDVVDPSCENTHPSWENELSHVEWPLKE